MNYSTIFADARSAARSIALLSDECRQDVLLAVADAIDKQQESLLAANTKDLALMDPQNPLYDRLQLSAERLRGIADDMRNVAALQSPLGHISKQRVLPNQLRLHRVSVPFGVIGIIYEARPNVTFDVFSLCFKSGNACVLKGGKNADNSTEPKFPDSDHLETKKYLAHNGYSHAWIATNPCPKFHRILLLAKL